MVGLRIFVGPSCCRRFGDFCCAHRSNQLRSGLAWSPGHTGRSQFENNSAITFSGAVRARTQYTLCRTRTRTRPLSSDAVLIAVFAQKLRGHSLALRARSVPLLMQLNATCCCWPRRLSAVFSGAGRARIWYAHTHAHTDARTHTHRHARANGRTHSQQRIKSTSVRSEFTRRAHRHRTELPAVAVCCGHHRHRWCYTVGRLIGNARRIPKGRRWVCA